MATPPSSVMCVKAQYSYPANLSGTWRIQGRKGMHAMLALDPSLPSAIVPYVVKQVCGGSQVDFDHLMSHIEVKPQNLRRFLASCSQELLDGLGEGIIVNRWQVLYASETVTLDWGIQDLTINADANISLEAPVGEEITIEHFLETSPDLDKNGFTKKDIRKLFVISKKIVKNFPRVISKGTPLRGLYTSPAT